MDRENLIGIGCQRRKDQASNQGKFYNKKFSRLSASQPAAKSPHSVQFSSVQPKALPFVVNARRRWGWGGVGGERERKAITHKIGANAEIKYLRKAMIAFWERGKKKKKKEYSIVFLRRSWRIPFFF